jgi:hypothetical protein
VKDERNAHCQHRVAGDAGYGTEARRKITDRLEVREAFGRRHGTALGTPYQAVELAVLVEARGAGERRPALSCSGTAWL